MKIISEFKDFIAKGNVMDLAIGVIIGGAFGGIVKSLVDDVITPAILNPALKAANVADLALLKTEGVDHNFKTLFKRYNLNVYSLKQYNDYNNNFTLTLNKIKKTEEEVSLASGPTQEELLTQIRDLLKK